MTPHITDHLHTGANQLTLGTRADHDPIQHKNQVKKPCINLQCIPAELKTNCMIKEIQESLIDDPQMDFYSTDDNCSDSEDDLVHLNQKSPLSVVHPMNGGTNTEEAITVAHIMNCPTIMVHAGKYHKALIDLGAAISLIQYSTYHHIDNSFKTPFSLQQQN